MDLMMRREAAAEDRGVRLMLRRFRGDGHIRTVLLPTVFILALLVLWEIASQTEIVDPVLVPAPTDIVSALRRLGNTYFFWEATWVTAKEALLGFVVGVAAAYLLGTAIGLFPAVKRAIFPIV